jgi:MoxR-like ATPase
VASQRAPQHSASAFNECFEAIVANVERVIRGKADAIRLALVCLVAEGHLLIEDVPGVGKTSLAKAIATSLGCQWSRIQFTPDLLPSDVTGVNVYRAGSESFEFRPGGIFANVVLGDEINRASPKTQSALLEAMEERQVTVDSTTHRLPAPFMVIATQNPIEHGGTYPLPESELDRFLMRIRMGYPDRDSELSILDTHGGGNVIDDLVSVADAEDVMAMVAQARTVYVAPGLKGYVVDLAESTRRHPALMLGMSPRATLSLLRSARAWAAAQGRDYLLPDDVKALAGPVLEHRMALVSDGHYGPEDSSGIIEEILSQVPVPIGRAARD